jgi:hypothetical protein
MFMESFSNEASVVGTSQLEAYLATRHGNDFDLTA